MSDELLELQGSVESIIYRNETNGYTVLNLSCQDGETAAVGVMPEVSVGEEIVVQGHWQTHKSYGEQFAVTSCTRAMPTGSTAILKYLSSRAVKGVGPATARRLVETFGENTLEVIEKEPLRMTEIKGISREKAMSISNELKKIFGMREVIVFLDKYNVPPEISVKIWRELGARSIETIESNPYVLCCDEIGVSFEHADRIAASMNMAQDYEFRLRAGIIYINTYNSNNGHTCLPKEKLIEVCAKFLKTESERISEILEKMIIDKSLIEDTLEGKEFIFLPDFYKSETYSAGRIKLMKQFPPQRIVGIESALENFEKQQGIKYAELQRKAILEAISGGLLILTGGPGTGKTTTLNAIISLLKDNGIKVQCAAPTGRAAHRMSELTGCEAKTIHRLLEVEWDKHDKPYFKRDERNMLDCDALVLDELSMVDSKLFESVLRALPMGCRLIMVGDSDQLPSVGAGNVLGDLIASGAVPVVALTEIFRQSMKSLIVTNAHKIVKGEMPDLNIHNKDFFFLPCSSADKITETIIGLCKDRLPKSYGYSAMTDIQVLCPGRKGLLGVIELNKKLQEVLNPPIGTNLDLNIGTYSLRYGDKVMQIRNNYDLIWTRGDDDDGEGVFNGDIGTVVRVNSKAGTVSVKFDDKLVEYDRESVRDLELAYATTVHKSQGNEFEAVIMPMFRGAPQLYYRNLLYTGVTRAKKLLILVGTQSTIETMVNNNKRTKRYSGLRVFLSETENSDFEEKL